MKTGSKGTGMLAPAQTLALAIVSILPSGLPAEPSETPCRLGAPVRKAVAGKFPGYEVLTLESEDVIKVLLAATAGPRETT